MCDVHRDMSSLAVCGRMSVVVVGCVAARWTAHHVSVVRVIVRAVISIYGESHRGRIVVYSRTGRRWITGFWVGIIGGIIVTSASALLRVGRHRVNYLQPQ